MRAGFGTPVLIWVVQSATCPPTVGVALGCAARGWFLRDDDPHGDVEHDARAAEDPQHEEQHPDQGRIHVEALGQATTHPGHLAIGPAAVQLLARVHGTALPGVVHPTSRAASLLGDDARGTAVASVRVTPPHDEPVTDEAQVKVVSTWRSKVRSWW